ncbi:MAG: GGDEF domain-containing protein [Treponema sp.]|nr:GGDEF domain-containing protein [Spirochaetia bacterium]MDD7015143.1 GGDEF domain-containing protein [Spirochaetales bacterium]MDY4901371.1 GGDEF domain-containing protein [Treponema sp.]
MQKVKIRGINLGLLSISLTVIISLVFIAVFVSTVKLKNGLRKTETLVEELLICEESTREIKETSSYLAEQTRLFIIRKDKDYADNVLREINETKTIENAFKKLSNVIKKDSTAFEHLNIAQEQTQDLIDTELYTINLCYSSFTESAEKEARDIVFNTEFLNLKNKICSNCNFIVTKIENQLQDYVNKSSSSLLKEFNITMFSIFVLLISSVLFVAALFGLVIIPIKQYLVSIKKDEKLKLKGSAEFKYLAATYNEIYEIKARNEKRLLMNAEYDALTGILNRRAFNEICISSEKQQQNIALLLIDIDDFKKVNDTFGHISGDKALRIVAGLLNETFRKDDYVARIGGDEFAAILIDFKPEGISIILKKLNEINEKLSNLKEEFNPMSISCGISVSCKGYSQELYNQADKALYFVKNHGKKNSCVYSPSLEHDKSF